MKNTILILAVVLFSSFASASLATNSDTLEGATLSVFGKYTITPSNQVVVIDNVAYKTWDLNYSGTNKKYQIIYSPGADGNCCFVVRGEGFEIQYAKRVDGFGVKLVDPDKRTLKKKEVMSQIDYDKFVNQTVLTSNEKSVEEYLGLVACFMPLLFG